MSASKEPLMVAMAPVSEAVALKKPSSWALPEMESEPPASVPQGPQISPATSSQP
jgi:hypothetical protein